jgi:hypothetical protein
MNYWIIKKYDPVPDNLRVMRFLHGISAPSMDEAIKRADMKGGNVRIGSHTPSLYIAWSDAGYCEIRLGDQRPEGEFDSVKDDTIPPAADPVREGFIAMPMSLKF